MIHTHRSALRAVEIARGCKPQSQILRAVKAKARLRAYCLLVTVVIARSFIRS